MKRICMLCCFLLLILSACAPPWKVMPQPEIVSGKAYQVELPAGWMRNVANKESVFISRDGPALQGIEIIEKTHKRYPNIDFDIKEDKSDGVLKYILTIKNKKEARAMVLNK